MNGVFLLCDRGARDIQRGIFLAILLRISHFFIESRIGRPEEFAV
jgi:hypothetical protein